MAYAELLLKYREEALKESLRRPWDGIDGDKFNVRRRKKK
jgi:hypothetical protein